MAPPQSPWAEQFCIIAWPITHAVLPLELHVPLLQAVLSLSRSITEKTTDDQIIEPLMQWAERGKVTRLQNLLHQRKLAADIVRGLLCAGYTPQMIDARLLRRIVTDLRRSREALRALREVQSQQARLRLRGQGRSGGAAALGSASPQHAASFVLRVPPGGQPELFVTLPQLPPELAQEVRALSRQLQPRLLGARRPILARQLLGGQELRVTTSSLPEQAASQPSSPLFEPASLEDLSNPQISLQLGAIEIDLRRPVLFEERTSEELVATGEELVAVQRRRRDYTAQSVLWVLAEEPPAVDGLRVLGQVCGLSCVRVELSSPAARLWLEGHDIKLVPAPRVELLSSPSLSGPRSGTTELALGDILALQISDHSAIVPSDGQDVELFPGLWLVPLPHACGDYEIPLQAQGGALEKLPISIREPQPQAELIRLRLGGSLSVTSLRRGALHLSLDSDHPIEDLRVSLSLWYQGSRLAQIYTSPLPALPQSIGTGAEVWSRLVEAAEASLSDHWQRALVLRVEVGGLAERQWWLEPELTRIWWQFSDEGMATAESDHDQVPIFSLSATEPLQLIPSQISPDIAKCVVLCQPQVSEDDPRPLIGSGICLVPERFSVGTAALEPPRLLRQLKDSGGGVGAAALIEGYLCWATASGRDLIAEAARKRVVEQLEQWTVEILCGERWRREEEQLLASEQRRLSVQLIQELRASGLLVDQIADDYLQEKAPDTWKGILDRRLVGLLESNPQLMLEPAGAVEQLDELFNRGYREAIREVLGIQEGGELPADAEASEADICSDASELLSVMRHTLRQWQARAALLPLLERVYAAGHAQELAGLPAADLSALRDFLVVWLKARDRVGLRWSGEEINELLNLWLAPSEVSARTPRLQEVLEKALIDRGAARALRYAAIRHREALREQR